MQCTATGTLLTLGYWLAEGVVIPYLHLGFFWIYERQDITRAEGNKWTYPEDMIQMTG